MLIYNKTIIPASTRMNATINSLAMQLENMLGFAIQIVFTGTPTGSFKLQTSCDQVSKQREVIGANGAITFSVTNWSDVANSTFTVTAAGDVFWNYDETPNWTFVRVVYTDSSSGSSAAIITSATINAKGF